MRGAATRQQPPASEPIAASAPAHSGEPCAVPPRLSGRVPAPQRAAAEGGHGGAAGHGAQSLASVAASAAADADMDVGRLLAGLQRSSVPDGEAHLAFLCQKFSALAERLRRAESAERQNDERRARLVDEVHAEEAEEREERGALEAEAAGAREEASAMAEGLSRVSCDQASALDRLTAARSEADSLARRRYALDEECAGERARLLQASGRLRQFQLCQSSDAEDLRRAEQTLEALCSRHATAVSELRALSERGSRMEAFDAQEKAELLCEDEARFRTNEEASQRREELDDALSDLAGLRERLSEVQVGIRKCEGEERRRAECRERLLAELRACEARTTEALVEAEALHDVSSDLSVALAEVEDLRHRAGGEEELARRAEAANEAEEAQAGEAERRLQALRRGPLEDAERCRCLLRSELEEAEAQRGAVEQDLERLRHEQCAGGGARRSLEAELRALRDEAERLRSRRAAVVAQRAEAAQRLQLVGPALAEARRRLRDVEADLEAAHAQAVGERQRTERLERETGLCQEKTRALRDENVRLAERVAELEAQLPPGRALGSDPRGRPGALCRKPGAPASRGSLSHGALTRFGRQGQSEARLAAGGPSAKASPATTPAPRTPRAPGAAGGLGSAVRAVGRMPLLGAPEISSAPALQPAVFTAVRPTALAAAPSLAAEHAAVGTGDACSAGEHSPGARRAAASEPVADPMPTASAPGRRRSAPPAGASPRPVPPEPLSAPRAPPTPCDLHFLMNWVRSEEERLPSGAGACRQPPMPALSHGRDAEPAVPPSEPMAAVAVASGGSPRPSWG